MTNKKSTIKQKRTGLNAADKTKFVTIADKPKLIRHPITHPEEHPKKFKAFRGSVYDIHGIGFGKYSAFNQAGIKSVKQFVEAGVPKVSQVMGYGINGGTQVFLRGLSVYQNRVIKIQEAKKLSSQPIYLDIETDPFQAVVWMIGIFISRTNEFIQLVANKPKDEPKIIKECLVILSEHQNEHIITYSGSRFDERILRKRFDQVGLEHHQLTFEDILLDIKKSFAFPLKSYSLGDLASFFGYKFKHPFMDGLEVASLYSRYSDNLTKFKGYKKLCEYNEDDVKSMLGVTENLYF
jgi:predicted RecB family nuclease